jgi:pilus assembly protein CpaE
MPSLTFIIMGRNQGSSQEIKEALQASGQTRVLAECDEHDKTLAEIIRLRPSAAILVLDPDNPDKEFSFIRKLVALNPGTVIIAAATNASPALILGSMRAGVNEFLQIPVIPDEFQTVLKRVGELRKEDQGSAKSARVIAVFSGKGGAGVSFLGTNLAAAVGAPTVLVDLNLQAGDAASFLGLDAKYSLADFARNRSRLDESLMTSLLTPHSAQLSLLAAPDEAHEAEEVRPEDIPEVFHLLGQKFECVVLDLPHTFDPITIAALDLADDILLTLTLDIPGIRGTKRALKVFDRLGYPRQKISVVVNRWSKGIDVELQKIEGHLGEQLIGFVPNDYKKVMESINLGRPLVYSDPSSKIALEIKRIASLVIAHGQTSSPQPKKKLFRSMFGRQSSTTALELSTLTDNA